MTYRPTPLSDGRVRETARVVAWKEGVVELEFDRTSACGKCGLCHKSSDSSMRIKVRCERPMAEGQTVRVAFPFTSRWRSIFWVFFLPLVMFFVVGMLASAVAERLSAPAFLGTLAAIGAAVAGLAGGLLIARKSEKSFMAETFEHTEIHVMEDGEKPG